MPWAYANAHMESFMKVHYVFELCPGLKIGIDILIQHVCIYWGFLSPEAL